MFICQDQAISALSKSALRLINKNGINTSMFLISCFLISSIGVRKPLFPLFLLRDPSHYAAVRNNVVFAVKCTALFIKQQEAVEDRSSKKCVSAVHKLYMFSCVEVLKMKADEKTVKKSADD